MIRGDRGPGQRGAAARPRRSERGMPGAALAARTRRGAARMVRGANGGTLTARQRGDKTWQSYLNQEEVIRRRVEMPAALGASGRNPEPAVSCSPDAALNSTTSNASLQIAWRSEGMPLTPASSARHGLS